MIRKLILFVFFVIFFTVSGFSQSYTAEGDRFFDSKDYKNALASYFKALHGSRTNPTIYFKIGYTYLHTETKSQAITFLEKAYKMDPEINHEILFYLGMAYQSNLQYAKAKFAYEQFKKRAPKKRWEEIDQRIKECLFSHALLSNPLDVIIENVGSAINSPFDDYSPVVTPDGLSMLFTSNRTTDSAKIKAGKNFEDMYISERVNDEWASPKKIGAPLSIYAHDAIASISPDGSSLFIYYETNKGDIYTSKKDDKGQWVKPVSLGKNVNTPQFRETSASITADGKKLYFSSDKPGGKGGLDIYVSELDATGNWGKAVNVAAVNTAGDEDSPFIHHDGVTLYFSSNGLPGMGSSDIYKSEFKNGVWGAPQNMGFPLNSIEYDGFFSISEDKKVAYFATMRKYGVGGYDILKATYRSVYEEPKPVLASAEPVKEPEKKIEDPAAKKTVEPVKKTTQPVAKKTEAKTPLEVALNGKVIDKVTSKPLQVNLSLVNSKTNKLVASIQSDKVTGNYELNLKEGGDYILTAESRGYLFNSVNIKITETSGSKKIDRNFSMVKPDAGSVMVLNNILFDPGKADLKPASLSELEKIRKLLVDNPSLRVRINGHTDNVGDPTSNKTLSLKRALAVVNYLALNGIEFERLGAIGYGSERPVASNEEEKDGRELNRRTEIEVIENAQEM